MKLSKPSTRNIILAAVALLVIVGSIIGWRIIVGARYDGPDAKWVYIPANTPADSISAILDRNLGVAGRRAASMWRAYGGKTETAHGAYRIEPGTRALTIFKRIARGNQTPVRLTFNNIRLLPTLIGRMGHTFEVDSATFSTTLDSVLTARGYKPEEYIGAILPDTYEFYWTTPPTDVVARLTDTRDDFWTPERTARARDLGLTPMQATIIASIAEEETNRPDERGTVARLYLNRFQRNMPLQADPTVKYAVGDFSIRRITGTHLAVNSPYNTYRQRGLPPGPIRMPERATIDSLLNSPAHDYLYMCASPDFSGRHSFARDFATHQRNAAAYHRALNARNIN